MVNKYLIISLLIIFSSLFSGIIYFKKKYENALIEIGSINASIEAQNAAIKQKTLELDYYNSKLKQMDLSLEKRYKDVKTSHKNCESELEEIKKILQTFHTR